jgi:glycosyltransferase involved in cell wall biosynthesis
MARILFVTQTAHPLGGVEVWLEDLAPALATRHDVTIGLVRGRRFHKPEQYLAARRVRVPTIEIDGSTATTEGRVRAIENAIAVTRADIVVPVNIVDTIEAVRRLKKRNQTVRLLYPLHGIGAEYLLDVREFRGVIDLAVTMNRLAERALLELGLLSRDRVAYTTYGVAPAGNPHVFVSESEPRFVFAGRLIQTQKRVLDLIAVCEILRARNVSYRLDIVGSGPEESALRSALQSNRSVTFRGEVSREQLYDDVYPGATALILLSEWETGPIVAWEAMRHGATIVTTEYVGLKAEDRLVDGDNALVRPIGDAGAIAEAIADICNDVDLALRLRRSAYDFAERHLRIEDSLRVWVAAFDHCLTLPTARNTTAVRLPQGRGRLDRVAGPFAESLRKLLRRGMLHAEAGSEWPHTYHSSDPRAGAIDAAILALDP